MIRKYKAFIIKRIHLSKPSIKHTSTKAIITLFSFNITPNYLFYNKFTKLNKYTNKTILERSKDLLKNKIETISILPLYMQGKISKTKAQKQLLKASEGRYATQRFKANDSAPCAVVDAIPLGKQVLKAGSFWPNTVPSPGLVPSQASPWGLENPRPLAEQQPITSLGTPISGARSKVFVKKELILLKYKFLNQLVKYLNFYLKIYFYLIKMRKYENIKRLYYNKLTLKYRRCQYRYYISKYKFEKTKFLPILTKLLNKFMNKKIEYNIINLNSIVYSPDIFTKAIILKLIKKKIKLHKYVGYVLGNVIISKDDNVILRKNFFKVNKDHYMNKNSFVNKYKNLCLINVLNEDKGFLKNIRVASKASKRSKQQYRSQGGKPYYATISKDSPGAVQANHQKLSNMAGLVNPLSTKNRSVSNKDTALLNYNRLSDIIFNKVRYKKLGGVIIRVKGRLSKRYRADRAVHLMKWREGLKDIDSSLKRLSTSNYRGYQPSHVLKGFACNKRRIGQYGVVG
jgi:hypothetical protein